MKTQINDRDREHLQAFPAHRKAHVTMLLWEDGGDGDYGDSTTMTSWKI